MPDFKTMTAYYVDELLHGDPKSKQNAFHSLTNADHTIVEFLIDAFENEANEEIQAMLIEIIWQHRMPKTLGFLEQTIQYSDSEVWKQSLDGIVTIGTIESLNILLRERIRLKNQDKPDSLRIAWIEEAIEQVREEIDS